MKPLARAFGAVLREARRARGLSQEQVAEFAEFDRTYPSLLERGLREPGLSAFVRLAAALRHSPYELLAATLNAARSAAHGSVADGSAGAAHRIFKEAPLPGHAVAQRPPGQCPEKLPPAGSPVLPGNAATQSPPRRRRAHAGPRPRDTP